MRIIKHLCLHRWHLDYSSYWYGVALNAFSDELRENAYRRSVDHMRKALATAPIWP